MRQSATIPSDLRAYAQALLTSIPAQLLIPYLYPNFYSLHDMPPEVRPRPSSRFIDARPTKLPSPVVWSPWGRREDRHAATPPTLE